MSSYCRNNQATLFTLFLVLSGCDSQLDNLSPPSNHFVHGEYANANTDTILLFDKNITIKSRSGVMSKPYSIVGKKVSVNMKETKKEARRNLVFLIADDGNKLLCSTCGLLGLGVVWNKTSN